MRILLIADYAAEHSGAFGSSMISLARRLRDDGDDVRFAFSGTCSLVDHIGIEFQVEHGIIKPGSRWNRSLWDAVKRVTSGWVPDLVHVHFGQASLLAGLKARRVFRCRLIWHVRGFLRERNGLSGFLAATYYRLASKRIDSVVCISNAIATDLRNRGYVQPGKLNVIHNGIPEPEPGQDVRSETKRCQPSEGNRHGRQLRPRKGPRDGYYRVQYAQKILPGFHDGSRRGRDEGKGRTGS